MKTICCFTILFGAVQFSQATIHTLCNMAYSPGAYTTFDDAQNAANSGDTIYVHGSSINYGSMLVYKSGLVIIGTGHHPNKQNPLVSSFLEINLSTDYVQLIGLTFNYLFSFYPNNTVKKCRILGGGSAGLYLHGGYGWLIEGNIFDFQTQEVGIYFNFSSAPNTIIQNNIFGTVGVKISYLNNSPTERTYILNNVFLGDNSYTAFNGLNYANLDNNIFFGTAPNAGNLFNCVVNNNISYQSFDDTFNQPGINNLVGVDPQFVNYAGSPSLFNYSYDFSLLPSSPGFKAGTDGTDRGVFGGIGFKFSTTGEPSIAEITAFTINGPTTIAPGGSLNVSITSKRIH